MPAAGAARLVPTSPPIIFPRRGCEGLTQQALAERFRLLRDQIRYALEQTNQEFARLFRAAVAGQVASDEEIDAEIRDIERLVGDP